MKGISSKAIVIDDAIEQFERGWQSDSADLIESVVRTSGLGADGELIVELIRVDIDRRYSAGIEVQLEGYFDRFPQLREIPQHVAAICFEDFRARKSRKKPCLVSRWASFPGVDSQAWFQELISGTQFSPGSQLAGQYPSTASFISSEAGFRASVFDDQGGELSGDRIGDFELVSLLGEGTFSKVFLARQLSLGRRYVAVKIVDRPMQEQFHLARLQHTGIVPLYSCHEVQKKWVLCMPYSGATTMARWLREVRLPTDRTGASLTSSVKLAQEKLAGSPEGREGLVGAQSTDTMPSLQRWHQAASRPLEQLVKLNAGQLAFWIFRRLGSALSHAHQRGLVHGDLKPANILFRNDGEPALIDFNLSQHTETHPRVWLGGTLPYMSKEQLQQLKSQTTGPALAEYDIHALGVIMFEILEGRFPFTPAASSASEDLQTALNSYDVKPVFRNRSVSSGLQSIIATCLSEDVAKTYPTATELLVDLEREASHQRLKYASESWFRSRLPKIMRRYPRALSAGLITSVSMLIIGGLVVGLLNARERSLRLQALESLQELRTLSDRAFGTFTLSKMVEEGNLAGMSAAVLNECFQSLASSSTETFGETWNGLVGRLSEEEKKEAEERLLGLGLIAGQGILTTRSRNIVPEGKAAVQSETLEHLKQMFAVLPERIKASASGRVFADILSESSGMAASPAKAAAQSKSLDSDAQGALFYAFGLMLHHQPEKALDLLSGISVPESLGPFYWMLRGRCQFGLAQYREAEASFSAVLSLADGVDSARMGRGHALLRRGKITEAEADFSEVLRRDPEFAEGYVQRADAWRRLGRDQDALADLNRAIELKPDSSRIRLMRMTLLRRLKQTAEADQDFNFVMQNDPVTAEDWHDRAVARLPENPEEALKDLQKAENLFGPMPMILQTMAHVLSERLHRELDSIAVLDRVLEQNPRYQKALSGRAVLYARAGNRDRTKSDVDTLLKLPEPRTSQINYQIACALALVSESQPELQQQALVWLARAVAGGYGGELLDTDPDLQLIRQLSDFQMIRRTAKILAGRNRSG